MTRGLILDFDRTLFDTSVDDDIRKNRKKGEKIDFEQLYSVIPQYRLYDGWREVFAKATDSNVKIGIVSTAKKELITRTLAHFGLPCDIVIGWQMFWQKPNPRLVEMALTKMCLEKDEVLSIGDSPIDAEMSKNAGVRFMGALWDSPSPEELKQTGAKMLDKPEDILTLLV